MIFLNELSSALTDDDRVEVLLAGPGLRQVRRQVPVHVDVRTFVVFLVVAAGDVRLGVVLAVAVVVVGLLTTLRLFSGTLNLVDLDLYL
jgi:hypothetical protein